eukprot:TRINITY_DN10838_c0_g1_i8.p1 TRINITY_DN10838_c0_g1~~TRINITY_DN10838_c0_g1_i8.p1  ORF type:complete len:307 (+),score=69.77 TRINITY_DN10838_c0_g1_i8:42-962(+)
MGVPGIAMNTGRMIPAISFGTGTSFFNRPDAVASHIQAAWDAGFTSYDTATIYGTEQGLGSGLKTLKVERKELFITTKTPDWSWDKESIEKSVRQSLEKLQLDYLDLVLIHTPAPRYDTMRRLGQLTEDEIKQLPDNMDAKVMDNARLQAWIGLQHCVQLGLVKDIGVSNYTVSHLQNLLKHEEVTIVPAVNQVEYNPYLVDRVIFDYCKEHKILVQAFAPLGHGKTLLEDKTMKKIAQKYNKTAAQIALRWAWQLGITTVTKTEKAERMKENLDYFDFNLTDEEMEEISSLNKNERRFGDPARFP